jgi:hypothetical protein
VQHNLGECGGQRFSSIIEGLKKLRTINLQPHGHYLADFKSLIVFDSNIVPFTRDQLEKNQMRFFSQGLIKRQLNFGSLLKML